MASLAFTYEVAPSSSNRRGGLAAGSLACCAICVKILIRLLRDPFKGCSETSTFRLGTKAAARATPATAATPTKMRDDRRAGLPARSVAELEELTPKPPLLSLALPEALPPEEASLPVAELT